MSRSEGRIVLAWTDTPPHSKVNPSKLNPYDADRE